MHVLISGAGISGLSAALSLTKFVSPAPQITIIETRSGPSTIGGAINLTPKCQRYLHHLGVHQKLVAGGYGADVRKFDFLASESGLIGSLDTSNGGKGFGSKALVYNEGPRFNCRRMLRSDLIRCLVERVGECENVTVKYGLRLDEVKDGKAGLRVSLSDASRLNVDLLLGCDGVHSTTRCKFVDPDRKAIWNKCAVALGFVRLTTGERERLPFQDTCLVFSQRGSFFSSFFDQERESVFIGALLGKQNEDLSQKDWIEEGEKHDVGRRIGDVFQDTHLTFIKDFVSRAGSDWSLYPVYTLPPEGRWTVESGRIVLLGDAAHAMPPQGESSGYAIEDTIVYARLLADAVNGASGDSVTLAEVGRKYEAVRRPRINAAYAEAQRRWSGTNTEWWLLYKLKIWILPIMMRFLAGRIQADWSEDLTVGELK